MANRITKQKWDEISGVDSPANGSPGWLLQKAADEVEDFEAAIVGLHKALGSESAQLFFKDADESVQKSVTQLLKHLDENIEDDDVDEDGEQEEVKKEKRGIAKLRDILSVTVTKSEDDEDEDKSEGEDDEDESTEDEDKETSDEDETDESGDKPDDEDETDDDEKDEDEKPVEKAAPTSLQKSDVDAIVNAFKEELDPIREAVGALADRTEGLEKHAAGRTSILGQDGSEDEDEDDGSSLHKAFSAAARGVGKIELN